MGYFLIISPNFTRSHGSIRWICREKPIPYWYKPNANDSSLGNPGKARGGGIIRDEVVLVLLNHPPVLWLSCGL